MTRPLVLVVDDDPDILEAICDILDAEGYRLARARHGEEALMQIDAERPAVILLDLMMPVMDGWAFVERCRRHACCADVPIVVTSASHDLPKTAERLRSFGVRTCLAKPFDVDGLLALVERYAPSAPAA
jgi:two-component system, chemotaxis family, chemotaxis protein CheY